MVRVLIHRDRLFTMFVPRLLALNGACKCGKHASTEGKQFLSRSRYHHHNNLHHCSRRPDDVHAAIERMPPSL